MNCKDFVQILWILVTILTGVVHSGWVMTGLHNKLLKGKYDIINK